MVKDVAFSMEPIVGNETVSRLHGLAFPLRASLSVRHNDSTPLGSL